MKQSLIIELEEKPYGTSSLWSEDMDIETVEVFGNSNLEGTEQRSCLF